MNTRLSRVLELLRSALLEDWAAKLLSLLVAAAVWTWVQSGLLVDVRLRADVQYVWPEGLVRYEEVPTTIALTVQGPQAQVRRLERQRPVIHVDLAESTEGTTTVDFGAQPIKGIPEGIRVVHYSPPSIEIRLERRMSRRVPVRVALAGEPPTGYKLLSAKAAPTTVELSGPRSLVRALTDLPTEPVDLSELKESRALSVPLNLSSRALSVDGSASVQVSVNIEAVVADRHFPEARVELDRRGWRTAASTAHVVLSGPVAELDRLDPAAVRVRLKVPEPEPAARAKVAGLGEGPGKIEVVLPEGAGLTVKRVEPDSFTLEREP